jgi:hypothetical protein
LNAGRREYILATIDRHRLTRRGVLAFLAAACGCRAINEHRRPEPVPDAVRSEFDQLVIHSSLELPADHRLLQVLRLLRTDILQTLALPASNEPIHIYLFETEQKFAEFMGRSYPNFPQRRAFFVESDTKLSVFAFWGDRVAEDLRHETSHGYLHSVMRNIPLWLDEGIAEYFEVPRGAAGLNLPHAQQLLTMLMTQGWRPNMARLESLKLVGEMRQEDYAESWAWVRWLLHTEPQRRVLLQQFLQSLRSQAVYVPLSAAVKSGTPEAEHQLCDYLFALCNGRPA